MSAVPGHRDAGPRARRWLPTVLLLAVTLLAAGACASDRDAGGDDDGAGGPTATAPETATGDGEPTADDPADTAEAPSEAPPDAAALPTPIRYVALGDSIAAGTAAGTSYVAEYADWVTATTTSEVTLTHEARPGWTTDDLLDALEDAELRAAIADAHLVTFNIGGNDLLAALRPFLEDRCGGPDGEACLREAVAEMTAAWDELLAELLTITDGETRGLRTLDLYAPRPLLARTAAPTVLDPYLDAVNDHLVTSAEEHGIEVARVNAAFAAGHVGSRDRDDRQGAAGGGHDPGPPGLLARDGLHPNDAGHEAIAAELARLGLAMNGTG